MPYSYFDWIAYFRFIEASAWRKSRDPPMDDAALLRFCAWLDEVHMKKIIKNYPYVKRTGATCDLSDNVGIVYHKTWANFRI